MQRSEGSMGLPNKITFVRVLFVPLVVILLLSPTRNAGELAAAVLIVASLTDWLDGYLARRRRQSTAVGKLLDPIADKLLVVGALLPLVQLGRVPAWIVVVIVCREIAVTGLRSIAANQGIVIRARELGKLKTVSQMVALVILALDYELGGVSFRFAGNAVLVGAMALGVASGVQYFVNFWGKVDLSM